MAILLLMEIVTSNFDENKTVYYVETKDATFKANSLNDALNLWANVIDKDNKRPVVISVGRLG